MTPLHNPGIYDGIEDCGLDEDLQTWASTNSTVFEELCRRVKPKTIIEVGSWKGVSAIRLAQSAPEAHIYCVDTWLCSVEHVVPEQVSYKLPYDKHGSPRIYEQFLLNVKSAGVHGQITPVRNTSSNGAVILGKRGVRGDLIFIDGSHEYEDVFRDLRDYYELLADKKNSIMFGDDFRTHPGVFHAVLRFVWEYGMKMQESKEGHWILSPK